MKRKVKASASILLQRSKSEKVLYAFVFVIFAVYAATLVVPFVWLFIQSLENPVLYNTNLTFYGAFHIPEQLFFKNYIDAFTKMTYNNVNFFGMFINSCWYIALGVTWAMFWPVATGYVMSKYRFKGREIIYAIAIFCMTIPIVGTTGASYKLYAALGIYDKGPLFVIVTGIGGFGPTFLIMYGIFKNISWSYAEAVFIDGGGHLTAFLQIMLPQAMPAIVALMIKSGIGLWNEYMSAMMYMPSTPMVATGLYFVSLTINRYGKPLYYAGLVISIIPIVVLFSFSAGSMMKNLSIGGIKG